MVTVLRSASESRARNQGSLEMCAATEGQVRAAGGLERAQQNRVALNAPRAQGEHPSAHANVNKGRNRQHRVEEGQVSPHRAPLPEKSGVPTSLQTGSRERGGEKSCCPARHLWCRLLVGGGSCPEGVLRYPRSPEAKSEGAPGSCDMGAKPQQNTGRWSPGHRDRATHLGQVGFVPRTQGWSEIRPLDTMPPWIKGKPHTHSSLD